MTMTIDEAIQHCKEQVQEQAKKGCYRCAEEHQQLAEWLKELKTLKVSRKELLNDIDMAIKASNMDDAYSVGLRNGMRVIKSFIDDEKPEYEKCCHEESCSEIPNTCGDAISRKAVLDGLASIAKSKAKSDAQKSLMGRVMFFTEKLPSVTPQQRMGRWIPVGYDGYADGNPVYDWWECSECGWEHTGDEESLTAFCPYCGAKMEVKE